MPSNNDTPNVTPPLPGGKLPAAVDKTGHIVRPLPAIKTVSESISKRAAETGDTASLVEHDPAKAAEALMGYNGEVLARLTEVNDYFKDKALGKIDPTQARAFQEFVRDHLAYINMRFVTLGRFDRPGIEDPTTRTGFEPVRDEQGQLTAGLDPFLKTMRSAHLAQQNGANLTGDGETEPA